MNRANAYPPVYAAHDRRKRARAVRSQRGRETTAISVRNFARAPFAQLGVCVYVCSEQFHRAGRTRAWARVYTRNRAHYSSSSCMRVSFRATYPRTSSRGWRTREID